MRKWDCEGSVSIIAAAFGALPDVPWRTAWTQDHQRRRPLVRPSRISNRAGRFGPSPPPVGSLIKEVIFYTASTSISPARDSPKPFGNHLYCAQVRAKIVASDEDSATASVVVEAQKITRHTKLCEPVPHDFQPPS